MHVFIELSTGGGFKGGGHFVIWCDYLGASLDYWGALGSDVENYEFLFFAYLLHYYLFVGSGSEQTCAIFPSYSRIFAA